MKRESHTFDREAAEVAAHAIIAKSHNKMIKSAKRLFNDKEKFQAAVESNVLPSLVSIRTCNNRIGTGFFQHPEWLVSNAHIFPNQTRLTGAKWIDWQGNISPDNVKTSYHRPSGNDHAPDIVIVNVTRATDKSSAFPIQFTDDNGLEERILFYIELQPETQPGYVIKKLVSLSAPNDLPMLYKCQDNAEPQPGSSGSPIIEARVIYGHEPQWQFKVAGVLYARCSATWHNLYNSSISIKFPEDAKLVCAIPVKQEFSMLFHQIIQNQTMSDRYKISADVHKRLGDNQAARKSTIKSKMFELLAQNGFQQFEAGVTNLTIALPQGLEKLYYDEPVKALYKEKTNSQPDEVSPKTTEKQVTDKQALETSKVTEIFSKLIRETSIPVNVYKYKPPEEETNYLVVQLDPKHPESKILVKTLQALFEVEEAEELWISETAFSQYAIQDEGQISTIFWNRYCNFQEERSPNLPPPPTAEIQEVKSENNAKDSEATMIKKQKQRLEKIPHSQYDKHSLFPSKSNPQKFTDTDRLNGNYPVRL